jgi:hypothetical protein
VAGLSVISRRAGRGKFDHPGGSRKACLFLKEGSRMAEKNGYAKRKVTGKEIVREKEAFTKGMIDA